MIVRTPLSQSSSAALQQGRVCLDLGCVAPLSHILDDYFEERYGDEDVTLTKFYGDFGFGYFDHDFMDTNGSKGRAKSIGKLIGACSFSSSYVEAAVTQAKQRGLEKTQYVVLLYDFKYDPKPTTRFAATLCDGIDSGVNRPTPLGSLASTCSSDAS